jgi:ABC-type spermidine/putrescine transport system permease subunit II
MSHTIGRIGRLGGPTRTQRRDVCVSISDALFVSGGQYQTLTKRMFTALRDEIDPTIAAISTLLTAASFLLVLLAMQGREKSSAP